MLDDAQKCAVFHGTGPALIVAGPGSGKTTVILHRIWYLVHHHHVPPEQILVLTFTKAAAKSLQLRFLSICQGEVLPVMFGTFHSIFFQILTQYGSYKDFNIITIKEKYRLIRQMCVQEEGLIDSLVSLIGVLLNNPSAEIKRLLPCGITLGQFQEIFQRYLQLLKMEQFMDLDQMASLSVELLSENRYILKRLQEKYKWVIVDEFQDTNSYQYDFLRLLVSERKALYVVGDDDQAIYSFRGSKPDVMYKVQMDFANIKTYYLTNNYRSCSRIVTAANKVISNNKKRISKTICSKSNMAGEMNLRNFQTVKEEYHFIIGQIEKLKETIDLEEMAIIGRTNRQLEKIKTAFQIAKLEYKEENREEKKAYSLVAKGLIELIERILGISPKMHLWRKIETDTTLKSIDFWKDKHPRVFMHYLLKRTSLLKILIELSNEQEEISKDFDFFLSESIKFKDLETFLDFVKKEKRAYKEHKRGINVLTMHGAKGLEFTYVCLIDINEGIIPGKQTETEEEMEEERRLLYVGMTRAKKILDVCYLKGTKEHPRLASRFLNPLIDELKKD